MRSLDNTLCFYYTPAGLLQRPGVRNTSIEQVLGPVEELAKSQKSDDSLSDLSA